MILKPAEERLLDRLHRETALAYRKGFIEGAALMFFLAAALVCVLLVVTGQ